MGVQGGDSDSLSPTQLRVGGMQTGLKQEQKPGRNQRNQEGVAGDPFLTCSPEGVPTLLLLPGHPRVPTVAAMLLPALQVDFTFVAKAMHAEVLQHQGRCPPGEGGIGGLAAGLSCLILPVSDSPSEAC